MGYLVPLPPSPPLPDGAYYLLTEGSPGGLGTEVKVKSLFRHGISY